MELGWYKYQKLQKWKDLSLLPMKDVLSCFIHIWAVEKKSNRWVPADEWLKWLHSLDTLLEKASNPIRNLNFFFWNWILKLPQDPNQLKPVYVSDCRCHDSSIVTLNAPVHVSVYEGLNVVRKIKIKKKTPIVLLYIDWHYQTSSVTIFVLFPVEQALLLVMISFIFIQRCNTRSVKCLISPCSATFLNILDKYYYDPSW